MKYILILILLASCEKEKLAEENPFDVVAITFENVVADTSQYSRSNLGMTSNSIYWLTHKEYDVETYVIKLNGDSIGRVESVGHGTNHYYEFIYKKHE